MKLHAIRTRSMYGKAAMMEFLLFHGVVGVTVFELDDCYRIVMNRTERNQ